MGISVRTRDTARTHLLERFGDRLEVHPRLDRTLVSFQANRTAPFYNWFRYKEGFSARLVTLVLSEFTPRPGRLMDPFAGAGAALFGARSLGWETEGIEVLPIGPYVIGARLAGERVPARHFLTAVNDVLSVTLERHADEAHAFRHIPITAGAFPPRTEEQLSGYLAYCDRHVSEKDLRTLLQFAAFSVLERTSYTRKDGQYLRWDRRSGRGRGKKVFHKGEIPSFRQAIEEKLREMVNDLSGLTPDGHRRLFADEAPAGAASAPRVHEGTCLGLLPKSAEGTFDAVLTSPPYCNRYDYTRTYALELAFLKADEKRVKDLRQAMLSCTVENREKAAELREFYEQIGRPRQFEKVQGVFEAQPAIQEVLEILEDLRSAGRLNNANIPRMVRNYCFEMCFVVHGIARALKPGGRAIMVNDNVQYAGTEIPLDLILSDFAESFGLACDRIWVLPRGKGNSSQQMGNHGRNELRKCVYVWEKC